MRVERKKLFHKIFRRLLNLKGHLEGYSGCIICGDTWNWKKEHIIQYTKTFGAFPTCEECWQTAPDYLIETATHELARRWILQSPPEHLKEMLGTVKSLKRACRQELSKRTSLFCADNDN